jgi:hypothetical protein
VNPTPPPPPSFVEFSVDPTEVSVTFVDCSLNKTWRPRRRDIRGVPPGAFDPSPELEKLKKKPEDEPKDGA